MTIRDAPSCGITYDRHSDDSRGVIYICNVYIIQATGVCGYGLQPIIKNSTGKVPNLGRLWPSSKTLS
jgi:hypothetical protein